MGIAKYNAHCRSIVTRYTKEWERTVTRIGRWIDFKNDYKTLGAYKATDMAGASSHPPLDVHSLTYVHDATTEPWFMESVWWVFSQLYEKGLVYQGYKVRPSLTFL